VRTKAIIAGAVVLALLLFVAFLFTAPRKPPQNITVSHVESAESAGITTMTFEIKNHTTDPYIFFPYEVQVRNSNDWTRFQALGSTRIQPIPTLAPKGVVSYTVNVTNLHAGSVVRFAIRVQKTLMGVQGFARRAELDLKGAGASGGTGISLNPNDKNSSVFGLPKEVLTEEWIETAR
jgi:hypothetical protein